MSERLEDHLSRFARNINPGNSEQSSFKVTTWACFFETSFVVGWLNIGSLFRLIGSVIGLAGSIIFSETNALN